MNDKKFYDDLWELFKEEGEQGNLQPGEKTTQMYADEIGRSVDMARDLLNRWVREGRMTKRILSKSAGGRMAYKPVKSPVENEKDE